MRTKTLPALLVATAAAFSLTACAADEPAPKADPSPVAAEDMPAPEPEPEASMSAEEFAAELPAYGEPYTLPLSGLVLTVSEPAPEDLSDWDDLGDNTEGTRLSFSLENPTDYPVQLSGELGYEAFAGTTTGEWLMCDSETPNPPDMLAPGRTAEWEECFATETTDDVLYTVYLPGDDAAVYGMEDMPLN